jgi:hypothetical protein
MIETVSQLATIIGVLSLIGALYAWRQSRDTFHQAVIVSCTNRFQKLSPSLQLDKLSSDVIQQYLELCNEELFYFEKQYLPQPVIDEWVEGMLSNIGLWCDSKLLLLPKCPARSPQEQADAEMVAGRMYQEADSYPRLYYAFTITSKARLRIEQAAKHEPEYRTGKAKAAVERAQMILEVLTNLQHYQKQPFYDYLRRRRAATWGS